MSVDVSSESVEYVEYLEGDYEENQEIVTIDEDNLQHVEYIEAEQVSGDVVTYNEDGYAQIEGHTVFEHNGKQYMIPNELHQSGQTILLEDCTPIEEGQQFLLDGNNAVVVNEETSHQVDTTELIYTELEDGEENAEEEWKHTENITDLTEDSQHSEIITEVATGRQYAILKDGKLHMEGSENQDKLQQLQQTLGLDDDTSIVEEPIEQVTGKNLITGQTISLSGFLEKLKRKADPLYLYKSSADEQYYSDDVKKQRRSFYNQGRNEKRFSDMSRPDYVLLPPVNKKVLVGKTNDGKNIVGNILQIWKKVDNTNPPPKPKQIRKKTPVIKTATTTSDKRLPIEEVIIDNAGKIINTKNDKNSPPKNVVIKKKIVSKAFLDENIVKTLSGLMELETIQKNLAQKNLVIKHILKKSRVGKILPGKEITYYYGHMEKIDAVDCFNETKSQWTFISDYKDNSSSSNIDLNVSNDKQQVELGADGKISFGSLTENDLKEISPSNAGDSKIVKKAEFSETVPVNLIVIEDEYGKKRTKVTIPQLPGQKWQSRRQSTSEKNSDHTCTICHRTFTSLSSLRRHMSTHTPESEYQYLSTSALPGSVSNRQYSCATCGKTFSRHSNMLRHSDIHRQPSANQKNGYTCEICGCHYNFISSLTRHIVQNHMTNPLEFVEANSDILLTTNAEEIIAEEVEETVSQHFISSSPDDFPNKHLENDSKNVQNEINIVDGHIIEDSEIVNGREQLLLEEQNVQLICKSEVVVVDEENVIN